MLRFSNLNKVSLLLRGGLPSGFGSIGMPFSKDNANVEEVLEKEGAGIEEEAQEDVAIAEGQEEQGEVEQKIIKKQIVRVYRRIKHSDKEQLDLALREKEFYIKGSSYGPFAFSKQFGEVTDEYLTRLQKEAFDSPSLTRETRSKIGYLISELNDPKTLDPTVNYEKIQDFVNRSFIREDYDIIYERDFRTLVFKKSFLPYIHVFLRKEFFNSNNIFSDSDLMHALQLILKDQEYFPLLQFIRMTASPKTEKSANPSHHLKLAEEFIKIFENSNQFNYLAFVHYYFSLSKGSFLDQINFAKFTEKLLNIYWGSASIKADRQKFFGHLYDLLIIKLNIEENQALKYYFADMFLTAPSYDQGIKILGNTFLILNRLLNNSTECNDLFNAFIQTSGEAKFDFYIKENLPVVLSLIHKKKLVGVCKQSLQAFQNHTSQPQSEIKPVILDTLDQNFFQKNSKIFMIYDQNSELDFANHFSFYPERKKDEKSTQDDLILLRKAMQTQSPDDYLSLFVEESQRERISREIYRDLTENLPEEGPVTPSDNFYIINSLSSQIEKEFNITNISDKLANKVNYKPRRYSPMVKESPRIGISRFEHTFKNKFFSTFIGSKRNNSSLSLTNKPFSNFGTDEAQKKEEKASSSPFKDYLKKAEEIDQQVKNQQLSESEVSQMKKSLFEKKKADEKIRFSPIEDAAASLSKTVPHVEQSYIFTQDYWNNIVENSKEVHETLGKIEDHFLKLGDIARAQNAIENFVNTEPLANKNVQNHRLAFYKMFNQPSLTKLSTQELENLKINFKESDLSLESSEKLQLDFQTNLGEIEKDYNRYLTSTVFHYSIGEQGYKIVLESLSKDYKRKYFKRCIAHIARFSTDISNETLELITNICYEQKLAFTLIEAAQLFIQNGIINRPDQLAIVIDKLRFFKDIADTCEHLAKAYAQKTGTPFSISLVGSYLDLLMKYSKYDKFMPLFDRLKESLGSQKYSYNDKLSAQENSILQEQFKAKNKQTLSQLYREFIEKLNNYKIYAFSKLLYKEQREMKLSLTQQDYINAIQINKDSLQDLEGIMQPVMDFNDPKFATKAVYEFLEVISENPKTLKSLIERILKDLIYQNKVDLTSGLVSRMAVVMSKTADASHLGKFLEFLIKEGPPLKQPVRNSFLRLLNASEEQYMKPQMLTQIDKLFSQEVQESLRQKEKTKKQLPPKEAEVFTSETKKPIGTVEAVKEEKKQEPEKKEQVKETKKEKKAKKAAEATKESTDEVKQPATKQESQTTSTIAPPPEKRQKFMVRKTTSFAMGPKLGSDKSGVRFPRIVYQFAEDEQELMANKNKIETS